MSEVVATINRYGLSKGTHLAYEKAWRRFERWCAEKGVSALPASDAVVAAFLADYVGLTKEPGGFVLERRGTGAAVIAAAIDHAHHREGLVSPCSSPIVRGLTETLLRARCQPAAKKAVPMPLSFLEDLGTSQLSYRLFERDFTLVTLGFFGAFRGAEVVSLRLDDVRFVEGGMVVTLRRSKRNPVGDLEHVPIASRDVGVCPVATVNRWLAHRRAGTPTTEWMFPGSKPGTHISTQTLNVAIRRLDNGGTDGPSVYSAHSMRRGFAVEALAQGESFTRIATKLRHRDVGTTFGYAEPVSPATAAPHPLNRAAGDVVEAAVETRKTFAPRPKVVTS